VSDILFWLAYLCFSVLLGFLGTLVAIDSSKSRHLFYKILGGARFWPSNELGDKRFGWEWRLAGIGIAAGGVYFLYAAGKSFPAISARTEIPEDRSDPHGKSFLLATLGSLLLLGCCFAVRPQSVVTFSRMVRPNQSFPDNLASSQSVTVRIIGACIATAALGGIWLVFRG
jgi:hypothetical protein